ncbi:MAG: UDP-2,3-diacylglucosamine diphosphatase LpxI [Desulfonauticus sp.]|nr:UDP-2,3-diacylglucosamine diphosphatase LpxI [Desulfonauticus sp.]
MRRLGLIAGGGQFPFLIATNAQKQNYQVICVGFKGHTEPELSSCVDKFLWVKLGQLGKVINFFKKHQVKEVIFAGPINKPKALSLRPDFRAAKLLFKLKSLNDAALFKALISEFESENLNVIGIEKFVPHLIAPKGVLSFRKPTANELASFEFGWPILKKIGKLDIGQCLVVKEKIVIAVEAIEGTNATIQRAGDLAGPGCIVLKAFKPGQDRRIDMPALGLETIHTMIKIKASALFFEAKNCLFFDLDQSLQKANEHNIAIVGVE